MCLTRDEKRRALRAKIREKRGGQVQPNTRNADVVTKLLQMGIDDAQILNVAASIKKADLTHLKNQLSGHSSQRKEESDSDEEAPRVDA